MKYLITGGSGFLGTELIKRLASYGEKDLRVMARDEDALLALKDKFPFVDIMVGDLANQDACFRACQGVGGIFHLGAFKHVALAEENVSACIGSNILGTMNLLACTLRLPIEFIIGVSTDKATSVSGVYGASKWLMERLFKEYETKNKDTKYRLVRFGNILYSTGSVLVKWKEKLQAGEDISITDPDSTRFYWSVGDAVKLIFECMDTATDSTPYVGNMKAIRLADLAEAMVQKYYKAERPSTIHVTGLKPGENKHEKIREGKEDSSMVERFTMKEILEMV